MKVIASYTIKGGVGKTTCAVNLAYLAAQEGAPVLLWDLEPQGASSFYFRIKPILKGGGEALLDAKQGLGDLIKATDFPHLDLLPGDFSCRDIDLFLEEYKKPVRRLHKLLKPLAGEYRYVFLDCPPSGSLLVEAVLAAADALLVPLTPTPLSLDNLARVKKFARAQGFDMQRLMPFLSMLDRRKPLHRESERRFSAECPEMLDATIPYNTAVERMAVERLPLGVFASRTAVATAFEKLWREVKQRLDADG
jgi:chromosome partitioning protein